MANDQSCQPCGCDIGANWVCEQHRFPSPEETNDGYVVPTRLTTITLKDARALGYKHYFTGKPCPRGHVTKRRVSTRGCEGCSHASDIKRYRSNREVEKARSRKYARSKLPVPTRPCPTHCELCGGPSGKRSFHLDHDHKTNEFRGWLCGLCNTAIGRFGDDVQGLQRAVLYLRKNSDLSQMPKDAHLRKQIPIATGFLDYFPKGICAVAHVSYVGNEQHHPGQPLHWDRNKSADEADALMRHFRERGTLDTDGLRHSAKVAWRAMALLEKELEQEK